MSSRRPLSRSYSGNGRSGSQNGEQVSAQGSRVDSRGYLHSVRPENSLCSRSTLCSVMAQLTEETQPSFETTLKSKAVSESCNVKFSCVVTGYPVPELTWYKDDVEMDRYCGLPKYEIFRNGKTHTLHIYNCTLEDAAIYQVSARNSKGIVSCSGVLEVGTMNEYQIHQRFFAKLKQKGENKRKELEESRQQKKDDMQITVSSDPSQRKQWSIGGSSNLLVDEGDLLKTQDKETVGESSITDGALESTQQAVGTTEVPNGFPSVNEKADQTLTYIYETVKVVTTGQTNKESLDKKKIKISNGLRTENGNMKSEESGNLKEISKAGISLAEYVTESLQTEASEDKERSVEKDMEVGSPHPPPEDNEIQNHMDMSDKAAKHNSIAEEESSALTSKQKESSSTQSPFTSMFFSLRDIFFGSKNKSGVDSIDSLDTTSSRDLKQDEKKSSAAPLKMPQQKKNARTDKFEKVPVKTSQMKTNDKFPSKDIHVKRTTPLIVHHEEPVKQGCLNPDGLKQRNTVTKGTESVSKTANKPNEAQAAEHLLNEQNRVTGPVEETNIIPRYAVPPELQSPCGVEMDTTGKDIVTTSTSPRLAVYVSPPPMLQGEGYTQNISKNSALHNKSLSSSRDESYSNVHNKEKKDLQSTAETSAFRKKKDNLKDYMKTQENTGIFIEVKDEVKEKEKAAGLNQQNETEKIQKIKPEDECGSMLVKSLLCKKLMKNVPEVIVPKAVTKEHPAINVETVNKEGVIKGPETENKEHIQPIHKTEGLEAENTEQTESNQEEVKNECNAKVPVAENKEYTLLNPEQPIQEVIVRMHETEITEPTESNQEHSNNKCNISFLKPGITEPNESNQMNQMPNKEGTIRLPVLGIKVNPTESTLGVPIKENLKIPNTGITDPIDLKMKTPNKECNVRVIEPGIIETNKSNLTVPKKEGIVGVPEATVKEPSELKLEASIKEVFVKVPKVRITEPNESKPKPPNKEFNVRIPERGIIKPSNSNLAAPKKEGIVGAPEEAIKESKQSKLEVPIKEDFVKVPKVGITDPNESKLEPSNKDTHVRLSELGISESSESNLEALNKEGIVKVPEAGIMEPNHSKLEPSSKECNVRVPEPRITEPDKSNFEALNKEGIIKIPEASITKQLHSNLELPNKELIIPELTEHDNHVLNQKLLETKHRENLEAPEYVTDITYMSEQSQLGEFQMGPAPLIESVLTNSQTGQSMVPAVAPVLQNIRDDTHHPRIESTSGFNSQKKANINTPMKHNKFIAETDNDLFDVLSLGTKEEVSKTPDNKEDTAAVTLTLKSLANVSSFVAPPISVTFVESICEKSSQSKDQTNEVQPLVTLLREVKSNLDTERKSLSSSLEHKKENSSFTEYIVQTLNGTDPCVTDCSTVVPLELLTSEQTSSPSQPVSAPNQLTKMTSPLVGYTEPEGKKQGSKCDSATFICHHQKDKSAAETSGPTVHQTAVLSPATMRRFAAKGISYLHSPSPVAVPTIQIESSLCDGKAGEGQSGNDAIPSCESSPTLKRADSVTLIPSATPEELASGARRKIFISKTKGEEAESSNVDAQARWDDMARRSRTSMDEDSQYMSPGQSRRSTFLQAPTSQLTPPLERHSPLLARKKATLEVPKEQEKGEELQTSKTDSRSTEKTNPFKAPQVIRKIRGEPFSDATGHLKLWCQFFNVLSDSTIKWYRDEVEIAEMERRTGDESQVALAVVQASSRDCGVYSCTIRNEYGVDSTDFLLSADILSEFILRDDLEAGEEIEVTPMVFSKGLADSGHWGAKLFGRIMIQEVHVGEGCAHKTCKVKVIYGLEPVFESGSTCVIKVRNPIAYGTREENNLIERNLEITKEECKTQNLIRQYCNIFAAEARVIENFGPALEIIPLYLMYRPANTVPYGTVEADLHGIFLRYCLMDSMGRLIMRNVSEVEQKCCAFQHWIHQFTNGNLLVTHLEGVGMKITKVKIATKSTRYQGLSESANLQVFQQFPTQHQCNQYCGLLGLHSLKTMDSLQQPAKPKGSRSPLTTRKMGSGSGSSSPQLQKKGALSPQAPRKVSSSPKVARRSEVGDSKSASKHKTVEVPKAVRMR
ncbi:hypothetical protein GN956_G10948 [Arapaima gigas]